MLFTVNEIPLFIPVSGGATKAAGVPFSRHRQNLRETIPTEARLLVEII